ncbi:MAG: alanine--tRNA ligase [Gammaproteobacteria bacterium]|nr:alanine--tRNA ligase [Gammaproteobacteria bacterium]
MTQWTTTSIRKAFLEFWESRGHRIVPSSSLIPGNDPTLLFTNAGMVQFKDCFLGIEKRDYTRATTSQRCVRAGGKHNDLENVGYTARHHTFFEMLGNFSFGNYFKEEAIVGAWTLLTEVYGLPKEKLWITVYHTDDEAFELWNTVVGVPADRIIRIGDNKGAPYASDNFWQMGDTGPCGPCTEIFYDHGPEVWGGPPGSSEEDGDRYIEIWNLVFMQFERSADGTLTPLPAPCVDTGMGLERIAAVLQHVHSNYEIDLFERLLTDVASITGTADLENASLKVIADHVRSCAFLIVDGVMPSNEGRGYVLRRIIRRALRHGYKLGCREAFFYKVVASLVREMGDAYPELVSSQPTIEKALRREEERFLVTLDSGMKIFDESTQTLKEGDTITGDVLFKLYDTYGFPYDLTADIAREKSLLLDEAGFDRLMEEQRQRARSAGRFAADMSKRISGESTLFLGYDTTHSTATVQSVYAMNGDPQSVLYAGDEGIVVLDRTPFYAESGGQVGDTGRIFADGLEVAVLDTKKSGTTWIHMVEVRSGEIAANTAVECEVEIDRRDAIVANHSATHLLHFALRKVLGDHVHQKGSLVNQDYLRFDFSHDEGISDSQMQEIETLVNAEVRANHPSMTEEMGIDEAKAKGAMALFGEKYGEVVRVVTLGPNSVELCGGVHVEQTGDIGLFKVNMESSVAAGVRRIEAITGQRALDSVSSVESLVAQLMAELRVPQDQLLNKVNQLLAKQKELTHEVEQLKRASAGDQLDAMLSQATQVSGVKVLAVKLDGVDRKALRDMGDKARDKLGRAAFVLSVVEDGKVALLAGVSKDLTAQIKAGDLVNHVAMQVGGKGGGRPEMAQAGGDQPEHLDQALASVNEFVKGKLG